MEEKRKKIKRLEDGDKITVRNRVEKNSRVEKKVKEVVNDIECGRD